MQADRRRPFARWWVDCLGAASLSALAFSLIEALLAALSSNALLLALPGVERARYLALIVLAFPVAAVPAAGLGWLVGLKLPRVGKLLALLLPAGWIAVESRLAADQLSGGPSSILAWIALSGGLLLALVSLVRPLALPRRATLAAVPGSAGLFAILLSTAPAGAPQLASPAAGEPPAAATAGNPAPAQTARNLLVLMVDTLRADHLGCYGYGRDTSPRIDAFAKEGVLFENAATPRPKTSPAIASFFTGTWPETHRVARTNTELVEENLTLAEVLQREGFRTLGLSANANISSPLGFAQGFDEFHWVMRMELKDGRKIDNHAGTLALRAIQWLSQHRNERLFVYVHFIDPHTPYRPPGPYATLFEGDELDGRLGTRELRVLEKEHIDCIEKAVYLPEAGFNLDRYVTRYDGEIRFTDTAVGQLLDALAALGLAESTAVVFTSDHGESMIEHRAFFNHGLFAYEEQVHIPLVIRGPGIPAGRRRTEQVSLVGLMPTLLDLVGVKRPERVEVDSFSDLLAPDTLESEGQPTLLSVNEENRSIGSGLRTNRWKYLFNPKGRAPEDARRLKNLLLPGRRFAFALNPLRNDQLEEQLYDLEADPGETENLAYRERAIRDELSRLMRSLQETSRPVSEEPRVFTEKELSREVLEDLRQLGYFGK